MCKQRFGDDLLGAHIEWIGKAVFPNSTNPEEVIKRLQEINNIWEIYKDVAKNHSLKSLSRTSFQKSLKWNKGELSNAISIIQDCNV